MQGNAVHCGRHAMFAHTIMDISAAIIVAVKNTVAPNLGVVGSGQIGRPTKQIWTGWQNRFKRFLAGNTGGEILWISRQCGFPIENRLGKIFWHITAHGRVKHGRLRVRIVPFLPFGAGIFTTAPDGAPLCRYVGWDIECWVRPIQRRPCGLNFSVAKWGAMHTRCALFGGRPKTNDGFTADQARPVIGFCRGDCRRYCIHIMPVTCQYLPPIGVESAGDVIRYG